jgi:hypothetical protein
MSDAFDEEAYNGGFRYTVRVSAQADQRLRQIAPILGFESPAAYLRFLAQRAANGSSDTAGVGFSASASPPLCEAVSADDHENERVRLEETLTRLIQQDNASIREALADFETGIQSSLRQSAATNREALIYLNALVQASVRQSTAAHYVSIMVWRLLAHKAELPAQGLPQHMRDEISRLHNRVFDAALTELRG